MPQDKALRRIHRAIDLLSLRGGDRLLELGCGPGAAAVGCAQRSDFATYLGIDRSPTAIAAARRAVATAELSDDRRSRIAFHQVSIAAFVPGTRRFDKIFAINVNLFWLDAGRELAALRGSLVHQGLLLLFFEPPVATKNRRIAAGCEAQLAAGGFAVKDIRDMRDRDAPFIAIAARANGRR